MISSFSEVIFPFVHFPVKLSSAGVIFLRGCLPVKLASEAAFLRSRRFIRHQYQCPRFNYGVYGYFGNIASMAMLEILPQCHRPFSTFSATHRCEQGC